MKVNIPITAAQAKETQIVASVGDILYVKKFTEQGWMWCAKVWDAATNDVVENSNDGYFHEKLAREVPDWKPPVKVAQPTTVFREALYSFNQPGPHMLNFRKGDILKVWCSLHTSINTSINTSTEMCGQSF